MFSLVIVIKCPLCARHTLGDGNITVTLTDKVTTLLAKQTTKGLRGEGQSGRGIVLGDIYIVWGSLLVRICRRKDV